jgi:hypothetical protein
MAQAWKCIHGKTYESKGIGMAHVIAFNNDLYPGARKDFLTQITIPDGPTGSGTTSNPFGPKPITPTTWDKDANGIPDMVQAPTAPARVAPTGGTAAPAPPRFTFQGEYPYNVAKSMGGNIVGTLNDSLKLYNHTYGTTFSLNSSGHIKDANGKWMTPDDNATLNHVIRTGHATGYAIPTPPAPVPAPAVAAPSSGSPLVEPAPAPEAPAIEPATPEVATSAPTLPEQASETASSAQADADAKKAEADAKAAAAQAAADQKQQEALVVATANKASAKEERMKKINAMRKPWMGGAASSSSGADAMVAPPITPASQVPPPPLP